MGAGHVGQKVAELAHDADFDVCIVDDREAYCNAERFPNAKQLLVGPLDESLAGLEVDENTFVIIVTRGHHHDEQALSLVAIRPAHFIGMIGSRRKIRLIFDDLLRGDFPRDPRAGPRSAGFGNRVADGAGNRGQHRRRTDRPSKFARRARPLLPR